MSLASDRRGRVPFALVGVVLLVGASMYATGVTQRAQPSIEASAATAMDDVSRDTRPALRAAVRDAARAAALSPVTVPADTPAGRALNDSAPFVDALRLRIAAATRAKLADVEQRHGHVRADASLPPIDGSTESIRRAKRDVQVTPVDHGSSIAVTVRNVTVRAREGGRVVAQRRLNLSLTVASPVLALHDRTRSYERRLNRGALAGEGLARGLTTRLTAVAMARGYGRYAGAPIRNVLGNRHVELSTNAALLAQQRGAFGRADPAGGRALGIATARVGVLDVLGGRHGQASEWTKTLLDPNAVEGATSPAGGAEFDPTPPDAPPIDAAPDAAADEAYLDAIDDHSTAGSYRVEGRLRTAVLARTSEEPPEPRLTNWTLLRERTNTRTTVEPIDGSSQIDSDGPVVDAVREVRVRHTVERRWYRGGAVRTTTAEWTETTRVAVRIETAYAPDDAAPARPIEPLFERGGALDGSNLAGARDRAAAALLDANGGVDAVAARVAGAKDGSLVREHSVTAARPGALEAWIAADLRGLRRRVANVSVAIPRQEIASGEANAPARLAAAVRDRRAALLDAPETYDGVADRARIAARAAYLDRVLAALRERAAATRDRNVDYRDELGERATGELSGLAELGRRSGENGRSGHHEPSRSNSGSLETTPDGSPAYLTVQAVDGDRLSGVSADESVHPLTARTTNWVALPYGDVADGVVDALFGGGTRRVSLDSAAGTLIAANRTAADGTPENDALATNREELTVAVGESVRRAEREVCDAATDGSALSRRSCRGAVLDARDRWPTLGRRAQAMANGSYAAGFADALAARGVDAAAADEAAVRARVRLRELAAERTVGVPAATTNRTASAVQRAARAEAKSRVSGAIENGSQRATRRLTGASRLPAGVPVAPPPYTWIATANAWSVTVRGEYQRFTVRAPGGAPDGSGTTVQYVRDGSTTRVDVDGDGERERLGRNERVDFEASTTVVAVVPPGMPGVGDVDGNRDERSPGWPCPGVDGRTACRNDNGPE